MSPPEKTWREEFKHALESVYAFLLKKNFGLKASDYRHPTAIFGVLILISLPGFCLGVLTGASGSVASATITNTFGAESQIAAVIGGKAIQSPSESLSEYSKNCDIASGNWQKWSGGQTNTNAEDKTYLALPQKSTGVLFRHLSTPKDITDCEFSFVPLSDVAINYVIATDGVFQVVVGDNDMRTVSLRANKVIDGPSLAVKETFASSTRPYLKKPIKTGSNVRVRVMQKLQENGSYTVTAEVIYTPQTGDVVLGPEKFSWNFVPSPQLQKEDPKISIGLLRGDKDKSEIAVNFLSPNPLESLIAAPKPKK